MVNIGVCSVCGKVNLVLEGAGSSRCMPCWDRHWCELGAKLFPRSEREE